MVPAEATPEPDQSQENKEISLIEKKLTQLDPKVFEGINKVQKQRVIEGFMLVMHKFHSGPLPDAETLSEYSNLIPDGANRIMLMAEKQSEHRMRIEDKVVSSQMNQSNLGQILAFLIGITAILCATYCIINGREWSGAILGVGGLTGLVTAFIQGRKSQQRNLSEKRPKAK